MRKLILICMALTTAYLAQAQNVGINSTGTTPDPSAMLDIESADKGLLIPRMNSTARGGITSPAEGLLVFDTDTKTFWYFNLTWNELGGAAVMNELIDADGDTKIRVDDGFDNDVVEIFTDAGAAPNFRFTQNALEFLDGSNIIIGEDAGSTSPSQSNVIIGERAGRDLNGNSYNTFVGHEAGKQTVGNSNTYIGTETGELATTGNQNTAVGDYSAHNITTGDNNTIIGANSGSAINTGSGNVILGRSAGPLSDVSNQLFINNAISDFPLIHGEFDAQRVTIHGSLNVNGNYELPTTDGAAGEVLSSDGAGNIAWAPAGSGTDDQTLSLVGSTLSIEGGNSVELPANAGLIDGDGDTKIEVDDGSDNDVISFFTGGVTPSAEFVDNRLEFDPTGGNMFIGFGSGQNNNGTNNTALGTNSGSNLNFGSNNTIGGSNAGVFLDSGSSNTYYGSNAGNGNVGGSYNTLIGDRAGESSTGNSNTFIGTQTGEDCTTGASNTMIGDWVAPNLNLGARNTILGAGAGHVLNSGSDNVLIGRGVNPSSDVSNRLYIDNSNGDDPLIYGEFDNDRVQINGTLNVNGAYDLPAVAGTSERVLTTDGLGGTSWEETKPFVATGTVVRTTENWDSYDFVFGSTTLDNPLSSTQDSRFQFDKSKSAFRAGIAEGSEWHSVNVGDGSFAGGQNNIAQGFASTSFGSDNNNQGNFATCLGSHLATSSTHNTVVGRYNAGPAGSSIWSGQDPLFEVGNGTSEATRSNALTIFKNGKVLIGTGDDISTAVGAGYDVVIDGSVLCEEVRVQDSGAWPDYVFEPTYDRLSFADLRAYLDAENHLPGVPSAAEVNGNGFELGAMNEILLEKIEELYLYVLELEEQVQNLSK